MGTLKRGLIPCYLLHTILSVVVAATVGAIAGYLGGWVEIGLMRITDVIMGFPALLLAVGLIAVLKPSTFTLIISIAFVNWSYLARIVYGEVLPIKARELLARITDG